MTIVTEPIPTTDAGGALIGYNNLLTSATIVGDSSVPLKALIPNTWERWRPTATTTTAKFQMSSAANVNYIAIAAHNLSGETITVQTAATIGGALTTVATWTPTDNRPIMEVITDAVIQEVALVMTLAAANEIGVVYAGELLAMPRAIYGGHSPIGLSQQTKYQSVSSESGQFLGRTITREGLESSFQWQLLDPAWYRSTFQPFVLSARRKPFFIKWRPDSYGDEVAFGHTDSDIKPSNMGGGHSLMSVSLKMRAHSDV